MLIFGNRLLKTPKSFPALSSSSSSPPVSRFPSRLIHTSTISMVAHKIDGTAIAKFACLTLIKG
jgi:hypothetical protein